MSSDRRPARADRGTASTGDIDPTTADTRETGTPVADVKARPTLAATPPTPPDPPLTDGVITLRLLRDDDAETVQLACSDPETQRWLDFLPRPYQLADARWFIDRARDDWRGGYAAVFAIADASDGRLLGAIAVQGGRERRPYIGYWVGPWARGRGAATRAVRLVSPWAIRTLDLVRLEIFAQVGNEASLRVAEKAGYQREGILRAYGDGLDGAIDLVMYSLLPADLVER